MFRFGNIIPHVQAQEALKPLPLLHPTVCLTSAFSHFIFHWQMTTWKGRRANPWGELCDIFLASTVVILVLAANSNWRGQEGHFPNDLVTWCDKQHRNGYLHGTRESTNWDLSDFLCREKRAFDFVTETGNLLCLFFLSTTTIRLQSFFRFLFFVVFWSPPYEHGG